VNSTLKNLMFWMVAALVIFLFWSVSSRIQKNERPLSFSDFMAQLDRGHVAKVTITSSSAGSQIRGEFKNGQTFKTFSPPQMENLVNTLLEKGVVVNARDANSSSWLGHIISWTPIVILIAFLIFFMRQMQGGTDPRIQARIWDLLSRSEQDLSEEEISSRIPRASRASLREALYRMVREGTVVFTAEKKYRVKTVD
jgi:ATP-dependent Zn protease